MTRTFPKETWWDNPRLPNDHRSHPQDWRKVKKRGEESYEYIGPKKGYYRAPSVTDAGGVEGVYVVQGQLSKAVKIGWSKNVHARVATLQIGSAERLELVRVLDLDRSGERAIHELCHEHRLHGEWFAEKALELLDEYPSTPLIRCTNAASVSASPLE